MPVEIINPFLQIGVDELDIRAVRPGDIQAVVTYFRQNRKFLTPWEPLRADTFYTEEGWEDRIGKLVELQKYRLAYYFLIREKGDDRVLGVITYSNIIQFPFYACSVGYSLMEDAQGRGVMRRALRATNQWLFDNINMHRVMAAYIPRNKRSEKVLTSSGFVKEGKAKDYLFINGKWEDHILTSVINPDWKQPDV